VRRELPDRLAVQIEEWQPLVRVALPVAEDGRLRTLLLVSDGRLLPAPDHLPTPELPWVVGVEPAAAGAPAPWSLPGGVARRLVELTSAVAATGLEATAPIDFVVAEQGELSILLQGSGRKLLLGGDDFETRIRRYLVVHQELAAAAVVDLRYANQVLTRQPEAPPLPEDDAGEPGGAGTESGEFERGKSRDGTGRLAADGAARSPANGPSHPRARPGRSPA
jgi:cell division septal protein FtsQ